MRVAKNGAVSRKQFKTVMQVLGFGPLPLDRLFDVFDDDGDQVVDYREMLAGISCLKKLDVQTMQLLFNIYDEGACMAYVLCCAREGAASHSGVRCPADNSGHISRTEFAKVLAMARPDSVATVQGVEKAVHLFELIDTDHDDAISFVEFKRAVVKFPEMVRGAPVNPCDGWFSPRAVSLVVGWLLGWLLRTRFRPKNSSPHFIPA